MRKGPRDSRTPPQRTHMPVLVLTCSSQTGWPQVVQVSRAGFPQM